MQSMNCVCFLPTAAEDGSKSLLHSSVVSDGDDGIVHNGCQHTQSGHTRSKEVWPQITVEQAEFVLSDKPDGTFLVREISGKPVYAPSSPSINTHIISVV